MKTTFEAFFEECCSSILPNERYEEKNLLLFCKVFEKHQNVSNFRELFVIWYFTNCVFVV